MAPQKSPRDQALAMLPPRVREQALRMAADHDIGDADPMWFAVALTANSNQIARTSRKAVSDVLNHAKSVSAVSRTAASAKQSSEAAKGEIAATHAAISNLTTIVYASAFFALIAAMASVLAVIAALK